MKYNIPGLHGGISQQSPLLRMPNQHEAVLNAVCDVVDGLRFPRPGTDVLRKVSNMSNEGLLGKIRTTNGLLWAIYREQYSTIDALVMLEVDSGTVQTIDISSNDYLKYGADLRLIPILDTVFLMNKLKPVSVDQVVTPATSDDNDTPYGLVYVEQAYENLSYSLIINLVTTREIGGTGTLSVVPAGTTLTSRVFTNTVPAATTDPAIVATNIGLDMPGKYLDGLSAGSVAAVFPQAAGVTYGGNLYRCIQSHTSSAGTTPGTGGAVDYWISAGATPATGAFPAWASGIDYFQYDHIEASRPEITITYSPTTSQHPLKTYSSKLVVDPLSETDEDYYVNTAPSYEDLPPYIPTLNPFGLLPIELSKILVFELSDGYYTKFDILTGAYVECTAPGQTYELDNTTLPYELEYVDTTWSIHEGDWSTFKRQVGNDTSAPLPDFVGRTLNDMFYYRGRLCFLSDNYVCMSRVNYPYDFFPSTATEVLDDDPICVFPSSLDYHELHWAKPFSKQLMLFSATKQYVLHSGYEALTPKTVAIDEATSMHLLAEVEPVFLESSMLLASDNGDYMGITEFTLSQQEVATQGMDLTESVPRLLPSSYGDVVYIPGANMALVYSSGEADVYCYKFHRQMDGALSQVAWTKWTFPFPVRDIEAYESDKLWILMDTGDSETTFTVMDLSEGYESIPLDLRTVHSGLVTTLDAADGAIVVDNDTHKQWESLSNPDDTSVEVSVTQGTTIPSSVTLSPLVLRDYKGLPRSDVSATIQNIQIDWMGGELVVNLEGQGLPDRSVSLVPVEYDSERCDAGASYLEPRPTRVPVMAPATRVEITLEHTGTRVTRVNNISYNLDIVKDWG